MQSNVFTDPGLDDVIALSSLLTSLMHFTIYMQAVFIHCSCQHFASAMCIIYFITLPLNMSIVWRYAGPEREM